MYPKWPFACGWNHFKFGKSNISYVQAISSTKCNISNIPTLYLNGCLIPPQTKQSDGKTIFYSSTTSNIKSPIINFLLPANLFTFYLTPSVEKSIKNNSTDNYIKTKNRIIKFYTDCPRNKLFMFITRHFRLKLTVFYYQQQSGPSGRLSLEDEKLIILRKYVQMHRLKILHSVCHINLITTCVIFLGVELKSLIYWPILDVMLAYQYPHFTGTFEGIEQLIQHSKNADDSYKTYKNHPL